jgi:hypothetical protein
MSDDKFIEFIIEDERDILLALKRQEDKKRRMARDLVDDLGKFGLETLKYNAPSDSRYILRHADKSQAKFKPGGLGGGGEYEIIVGIKSGESKHPLYVEFGTGIYGITGKYISPITAISMTWFSKLYGRSISKKTVKGQRPQRYFYETWKEVEVYARMQLLGNKLNPFN